MENSNKENQPVQQPHPTLVTVNSFLNDCLTENEFFARCSAILQLIHPKVIVEAARQIQEHEAANANTDKPAE